MDEKLKVLIVFVILFCSSVIVFSQTDSEMTGKFSNWFEKDLELICVGKEIELEDIPNFACLKIVG